MTGKHGLISSVILASGRRGEPTGSVGIEIWDDNRGQPSSRIAQIGTIDLATLNSIDEGGEFFTLNHPITDLRPNSPYYMVSGPRRCSDHEHQ